jgi:hypothetical protein
VLSFLVLQSDVSWSAFQVVLTLKAVFESITCLYKPFPVIKTLCSGECTNLRDTFSWVRFWSLTWQQFYRSLHRYLVVDFYCTC